MKQIARLLPFCSLLWIISCQSDVTRQSPGNPSVIGAAISITQQPTDKNANEIIVDLFDDDGKVIADTNLKIKVNHIDMEFKEHQDLYYKNTAWYYKVNVPVIDTYSFEITLTGGRTYLLGRIKTIEPINEDNIIAGETGDPKQDYVLKWSDLKEINKLSFSKTIRLNTSTETEEKIEYSPEVTRDITGNGSNIIPRSFFSDAKSTISSLDLKFSVTKSGYMNPLFLRKSKIQIQTSVEKTIRFDKGAD